LKDRDLNGGYKQDRHLSDSKKKTPMLPIEKEPHFPDYFKDNRADSPGGNVVFPPVKTEVKNCQDGCAEK
jgi:hypothetical protein